MFFERKGLKIDHDESCHSRGILRRCKVRGVRITDQKKLSRLGKKGFIYSSFIVIIIIIIYSRKRKKKKRFVKRRFENRYFRYELFVIAFCISTRYLIYSPITNNAVKLQQ